MKHFLKFKLLRCIRVVLKWYTTPLHFANKPVLIKKKPCDTKRYSYENFIFPDK